MVRINRVALVLISAVASVALAQQQADPRFTTRVDTPAFVDKHPVVLFDEAHHNFHTAGGRYKPFADLMTSDGFRVTPGREKFTPALLAGCNILVIANALGRRGDEDPSAFAPDECQAVQDWIDSGGSLLVITDHPPFGAGSARLARRFGADMSLAATYDPENETDFVLQFDRNKDQLGDHPIINGRGASERVDRVLTFLGQSLKGPTRSTALLRLADTAFDAGPRGKVSAARRAQGLALRHGKGRVVMMGEAAELTAQVAGDDRFGMNVPGCDNRQLALNIMHWLAGLLDP
ncbi:MAG TPA: hypothetical protein VHY91_20725 [Pirellulales bacterium]|jgi:hypothetical protein|nr:hypothetical protein [Pirellulales bacterium]